MDYTAEKATMAAARESQVTEALADLDSALERLEAQAKMLEERLAYVLRDTEPPSDTLAKIAEPLVPLAAQLRSYAVRALTVGDALADIRSRVEL